MIVLFTALAFAGCKKDVVTGPAGVQGQQGEQGEQGEPGNANVITKNFTIYSGDWTLNSSVYVAYDYWEDLYDMEDGFAVFGYIKLGSNYWPLPHLLNSTSNDYFTRVTMGFSDGSSLLSIAWLDDDGLNPAHPGNRIFRAVAVNPRALALGDEYVEQLIQAELAK